jgi:guanosine-3',5'-bis(diphosphate) 3'-pyrophosphohydrolase
MFIFVLYLGMAEVIEINVEERTRIRDAYEEMISAMRVSFSEEDRAQMDRAFELANYSHRHQRRKSGEPYIFHPIAVARICGEEIGLGTTAICAALMHDVVEDTPVTLDESRHSLGNVSPRWSMA